MTTARFSHLNQDGEAKMVDITHKAITQREALAEGVIYMSETALQLLIAGECSKGDVFAVARIAGIQAAKKTSELIPLCHPLMLSQVTIECVTHEQTEQAPAHIQVRTRCKLAGQTGVEMEALTATTVVLLTIYDMCKAVDANLGIGEVKLLHKRGGKSHGRPGALD